MLILENYPIDIPQGSPNSNSAILRLNPRPAVRPTDLTTGVSDAITPVRSR
jgi:hypothetical protein